MKFLNLLKNPLREFGINSEVPGQEPIFLKYFYDEFAWYYPKCEVNTKRWFVQNVKKNWICVDAGANVGIYTILLSRLCPEGFIYAFEPTQTVEMLKKNCQYHQIENIKIVPKALGAQPGLRKEKIYKIWGIEPKRKKFFFTTIDKFLEEENVKAVNLIKIDVDSFDFEVLQGTQKTMQNYNPWLVVELNHALAKRGQSNSEAFLWLRRQGYSSALVIDHENFILKRGESFSGDSFELVYPVD